jgi:hypothetical protein
MFQFSPEHGSPENLPESPRLGRERLESLVRDSDFLAKMEVLEMDLRESNTVSLEKAFHESLDEGEFHQFLDMCQSVAERLGEEEKPILKNFLIAVVMRDIVEDRLTGPGIEELQSRLSNGDFN